MKYASATLKSIVFILTVFIGQAFADPSNQFLSCVGDNAGRYEEVQLHNQPFTNSPAQIKTLQAKNDGELSKLGIDRRLTLLSIRDKKGNIMLADTNNKSNLNPGLLIFDNVKQAKDFCDGLAKICTATFNTKDKPYTHPREVQFLYIYQNSQKLFLSGKAQLYRCFPIREEKEILSVYE